MGIAECGSAKPWAIAAAPLIEEIAFRGLLQGWLRRASLLGHMVVAAVTLYNGATALGSAVADAQGNYTIVTSALADGSYNLSVQASDAAGNTATGTVTVTVPK